MTFEIALALVGVGLLAGFLAGLFGIGGGVVLVPALVLLLDFDQHAAQGTSLLVIVPAAVLGSWTHHRQGRLALPQAVLLAAGGVVGTVLGGAVALSLDEEILRRIFAIVVVVMGIRLLLPRRRTNPPVSEAPEGPTAA
ncbi:MAG TPA: sulfite exporter TauE/SafE family protein [Candidatus Limnocylindria bacterium]|nr:sulfite exporter TauE/SafE family protein [Candidatus Limnocylindria bacterium]